ncbi:hypothetical protein D3C72_2549270 [compost metagenome]
MKGNAKLADSESNLDIDFSFNKRGYVVLTGRFKEDYSKINELIFELVVAQPQLQEFIDKLKESLTN